MPIGGQQGIQPLFGNLSELREDLSYELREDGTEELREVIGS